jgi:hypothetical protein
MPANGSFTVAFEDTRTGGWRYFTDSPTRSMTMSGNGSSVPGAYYGYGGQIRMTYNGTPSDVAQW